MATGFAELRNYRSRVGVNADGSRLKWPLHGLGSLVLAVWKYAIILEGLYRHSLEGTAANPKAAEFAWKVPQLVQRAQRIMAEAG